MATFYNQATLNLGTTTIPSNVTEGEILSTITLTKASATTSYTRGGEVTYVITLTNSGTRDSAPLTLVDNLGEYSPTAGCTALVPISYIDSSLLYYVNGIPTTPPTVTVAGELTVSGIIIPAGGTVTLIYTGTVNELASLTIGSEIVNTATLTCYEDASDTASVPVREETNLSITKSLCPTTVGIDGEVSYTFIIQNSGNKEVLATDSLTVRDVFTPPLSNLTVTVNGTPLAEGTGYTYDETSGEFQTLDGALTVPSATYTRDPVSCAVGIVPGYTTVVVRGNV